MEENNNQPNLTGESMVSGPVNISSYGVNAGGARNGKILSACAIILVLLGASATGYVFYTRSKCECKQTNCETAKNEKKEAEKEKEKEEETSKDKKEKEKNNTSSNDGGGNGGVATPTQQNTVKDVDSLNDSEIFSKFQDRIYAALAKHHKRTVEEEKKAVSLRVVYMDEGGRLDVSVGSNKEGGSFGGGYGALFVINGRTGKYEWIAGGQMMTREGAKKAKDAGFPKRYWENALK